MSLHLSSESASLLCDPSGVGLPAWRFVANVCDPFRVDDASHGRWYYMDPHDPLSVTDICPKEAGGTVDPVRVVDQSSSREHCDDAHDPGGVTDISPDRPGVGSDPGGVAEHSPVRHRVVHDPSGVIEHLVPSNKA